jgi:hypothetical protein
MFGPMPRGHWSSMSRNTFRMLRPDERYRVVRDFSDFDGAVHPAGESWRYLGYTYAVYDSGVSLFVSLDDKREWQIALADDDTSSCVAAHLDVYLVELP